MQLSAKCPMALAIGCSVGNTAMLTRFVNDSCIGTHNNTAEHALRLLAMGGKLHWQSDVKGQGV
jgi:hypothetical protein